MQRKGIGRAWNERKGRMARGGHERAGEKAGDQEEVKEGKEQERREEGG
jgi:hypothetical protein